jgi:tRNA nucleotidyltransferase/poly(A) polymerase
MKEINEIILPQLRLQQQIPQEIYICSQYVDDGDFYNTDNMELNILETLLPTICSKYNLHINITKTERYQITAQNNIQSTYPDNRQQYQQFNIRKLGSYVGQTSDLQKRIQSITSAFKNLNNLWFRPHALKLKHRLRLYNIYIYPLIRYNLGTAAYTQKQMDKLDACHRKQLRRILHLFYPNTIHNKQLYNKTNSAPVSLIALEQRWKLFGHILRSDSATPAKIIMEKYYQLQTYQQPGRPRLTLATNSTG